ncbi:hypothetical protein [Natrinema salaciae]|uniref:Uncharacterized protein n=1 Tax=Natrinema salaciae TaxID=1186196 RepID=A0A1H9NZ13_9EURY|nr:hypothetical protein [Natrinema salaciae]SER40895.1 hypothetical protein SAMN04489841_3789 [Natrinema salaciae]
MARDTSIAVAAIADRDPGEDDDPYDDVEIASLPDWWADAVQEFESYNLRAYRPPRFADGTLKHAVVKKLETKLGVSIRFVGRDVSYRDDWEVQIDGEKMIDIGRHRNPDGYTVFEIGADEFVDKVTEALEE